MTVVYKTTDDSDNSAAYPRITMVQNASVARGEEATLLCKVESTPASDISWHRLDVPLGPPEVCSFHQQYDQYYLSYYIGHVVKLWGNDKGVILAV